MIRLFSQLVGIKGSRIRGFKGSGDSNSPRLNI